MAETGEHGDTSHFRDIFQAAKMVHLSSETEEDPCALFYFLVWGIGGVALFCFGYTGNILSLIALHRDTRNPATTLLQSLAVSDLVLLTTVCITEYVPRICDYTHACHNIWNIWPPVRYLWLLVPMSHMCSIWIAVLIAANRYWAVCRPHQMVSAWTNYRTGTYIVCVVCAVVIFNVPRIFEYRMVYKYVGSTKMAANRSLYDHVTAQPDANITTVDYDRSEVNGSVEDPDDWKYEEETTEFGRQYSYIYKVVLVNSLLILLPLGFLLVSSIWVIRSLHIGGSNSLIKKRKSSSPGTGDEIRKSNPSREVTFVLVTVVLVAVACQTPLAVFHFVRYRYKYLCGHVVFYLENISKYLVNVNACLNFVIYCILGPRFRRLLVLAVTCDQKENSRGRLASRNGGEVRNSIT